MFCRLSHVSTLCYLFIGYLQLTGLGAIWTMTDIIHMGEEEEEMKVPAALSKLDTSGILFFLGILMSIGVLDKSGLLKECPSLTIILCVTEYLCGRIHSITKVKRIVWFVGYIC